MKIKSHTASILYLFFGLCLSFSTYAQNKFVVSNDIFGQRVFIKNNGQFDGILPNNAGIDYAYTKGGENVFFNKKGVTYFLQKINPLTHSQFEAIEHGKKVNEKPSKKAFVNVSWENSNPNVEIIVSEKQAYYHSFGDEKFKSECYKKITYKNIYNKIDIEYLFTNEREDGIKYNIILHPGANVNDIKIKYSGDFKKIISKKGNVIIKTAVRNITELAPVSYQQGKKVVSNFSLENNILSFNLPNGYDTNKELVIDPWVINLALNSNNYAFDVDYDYAGNYYIYGGSGPFLISKYTPSGTLLWTFGGTVPSAGWSSLGSYPSQRYTGNFIVDKITGKSYTGEGFNNGGSGTRIVRINSSGVYDNFISTGVYSWNEVWDMGYRCSDGAVMGFGGSIIGNTSAGILNTTTGSIVPKNFTGLSTIAQDVVSHTIDASGNLFLVFASAPGNTPSLNNRLMLVNNTFSGNVWIAPTNYSAFSESDNKRYPNASMTGNYSNGFNALTVNDNYLYYYDGYNLAAYNKSTGARIGFTTITSQTAKEQGGIAVDNCNNVYVGGNGFIYCYNFNGTTFTANGTIPVASSTTSKYVTDIKFRSGSTELYVSGSGFGGIYTAINSLSCSSNAAINVTQTTVAPNNTTASATVTTSIVSPLITYTWFDSNNAIISQTNSTTSLTDTVANLVNGTYTVLIQIGGACGTTSTHTFTIGSSASITPVFTQVAAICSGETLSPLPVISDNGITGTWSPALNNTATTTYTFTPDTGQNATTATMIITVIPNTIPTFSAVAPICSGDILAPLPTTSNNGISGTWSPALNNTTTTTYVFTPTSGACVTTSSLTITVNPIITPTFDPIDFVCWGETAPVLPSTSLNGISGTWQPPVINNTTSGTYQFTPAAGQCAVSPPALNVTIYDDFDFIINQECIDKNYILQVLPLANSFDVNTATIIWKNSNNIIVSSNSPTFNVTNYLHTNSITPQFPLQFSAEVTLANGCTKSHIITINKVYCDIQNGISPNGDNANDYFDLELMNVKKLSIFNRYGVKVYSKSDYKKEWYGQTDSGQELPDATYFYLIEFNNSSAPASGWIYVIRQIK